MNAVRPVSHRVYAILRAVASGRAEATLSSEPDLFIDGLACCDQYTAHCIAHSGLIRAGRPGTVGQRVPVTLTADGWAILSDRAAA